MKNLQSYLGNFDFYLGKSSELPAEPLSADEPSQVASMGYGFSFLLVLSSYLSISIQE